MRHRGKEGYSPGKEFIMKKLVSLLLIILAAAIPAAGCAKKGAPKLPPARWGLETVPYTGSSSRDIFEAYSEADAVCLVTIGSWIDESMYVSEYDADIEKVYKGTVVKPGDTVRLNYDGSARQDRGAPLPIYGTRALVFLCSGKEDDGYYECRAAEFFYEIEYEGERYLVDLIGNVGYKTFNGDSETDLKNRYTPALRSALADSVRGNDPELAEAIKLRDAGPGRNMLKIFLYGDIESLLYSISEDKAH